MKNFSIFSHIVKEHSDKDRGIHYNRMRKKTQKLTDIDHICINLLVLSVQIIKSGLFQTDCFGQYLGWVVLALVGGSFRPMLGVSRFGPQSFHPSIYKLIRYDRHMYGQMDVWFGDSIFAKQKYFSLTNSCFYLKCRMNPCNQSVSIH